MHAFFVCLGQIILSGGEAYSQHHGGENEAGSKVHPNEGTEKIALGLWLEMFSWEGELKKVQIDHIKS